VLEYARWKYLLVAGVLVLALLFALPNVFGEDPALQVARKDHNPITADAAQCAETVREQAARQVMTATREQAARTVEDARQQAAQTRELARQRMPALVSRVVGMIRQLEGEDP